VKLTAELYLVSRLRMSGAVLLVLYAIMSLRGRALLFDFGERVSLFVSATGILRLKQHELYVTGPIS
jgi:hypothetical protein